MTRVFLVASGLAIGLAWGTLVLRVTAPAATPAYVECFNVAPDAAMGGAPLQTQVRFCIPSKDVPLLYN